MNLLITILLFFFLFAIIYQIACGFPLIYKTRQRIRQNRWTERLRLKAENEAKIKYLDKELKGKNEVKTYITLNRFTLPEEKKWETLLPHLIKDLLAIGWTTEMPIYTKFKYGKYEFHISTSNQSIINQSIPIFHKYLDQYDQMDFKQN